MPPGWPFHGTALSTQCLVPAQISSVLSAFNLSRSAVIHWPITVMHCSNVFAEDNTLLRSQCTCNWLSSANAWRLTPKLEARSARSAVYKINNSGSSTEPCGIEHVTLTACEVPPPGTTRKVLPVKYDLNHALAWNLTPNVRSSRDNNRSWSTVSNAAAKSNRQRPDTWPRSVATSRSLNSFNYTTGYTGNLVLRIISKKSTAITVFNKKRPVTA